MELRQFRYVIEIAAEQNFSRAAEKPHIAQPSLSQQLSKLEKELGTLLFQRSTNSVELTHAGQLFVDKAQQILDLVDQLQQEMEDISQMKKGKLVVGSLPITGSHILPLVLPLFKSRYPHIEIVLVEDTTVHLEVLTHQGKIDVCLLSLPIQEKSLQYESIIEEEICLAVSPQHRLAKNTPSPIPLKMMKHEPFIVLKRGQGFRQITLDLCKEAGFTPQIVFESSNIETVQSLVATGMGIALVPKMVTRTAWSQMAPVYHTLAGQPSRKLVIAYRKDRYLSKAADAFIQTLKLALIDE